MVFLIFRTMVLLLTTGVRNAILALIYRIVWLISSHGEDGTLNGISPIVHLLFPFK
jgi:hypothetical protein